MELSDVIKRTWNDNILLSALIELTYRCNLDCFFCYNDTELTGTPLSRKQYSKLFKELRDMGAMNLTLSGGEPLAHPDFFQLGSYARELGFVVRIKSNGHALRERLAARIKNEIDPFIIEISLHGACAETHDRQTRIPGSFEKLMENLEILKKLQQRFQLNTALTNWNESEVETMYGLADSLDVNLQVDTSVTPRDNGDLSPINIAPSGEAIRSLFLLQEQRAKKTASGVKGPVHRDEPTASIETVRHCGAGSASIAVDPYGEIYPCVQWRKSIGSLHENSIAEIWSGNSTLEQIRSSNIRAAKQVKALDKRGKGVNFCPGLAETLTGLPTKIYPHAKLRQKLLQSVNN